MIAYLNGKYVPSAEAVVSVSDYGFAMGVSLTERLRTFGGKLPLLQQHLDRMLTGVEQLGLGQQIQKAEVERAANEVVRRNLAKVKRGVELSVGICVTPGVLPGAVSHGSRDGLPTVVVTAGELQSWRWESQYRDGVQMMSSAVREIPGECIPRSIKHRNRLHYYLAEKQVAEKSPGKRALLLDTDGFVSEGTIASIVAVKDGQVLRPKSEKVLPSITLGASMRMFEKMKVPVVEQDLSVADFQAADEVLWLSTSPVVLPVVELDGMTIGTGDRPVFQGLARAWEKEMECQILPQ
jgi:branched-subunit amino acid aminotransferase/4-amino-4-deoxychorismate lyase